LRSRFVSFGCRFIPRANYRTGRSRGDKKGGRSPKASESWAGGNFIERERTKLEVRGSRLLLPAGLPRSFIRMRHRIAAFLGEAPILFVGVVLGVAVLFRLAIDVVRPASADAEPETPAPSGAALHEPPRIAAAEGSAQRSSPPPAAPTATSPSTRGSPLGTSAVAPGGIPRGPLAAPPRRKPRTHGRR